MTVVVRSEWLLGSFALPKFAHFRMTLPLISLRLRLLYVLAVRATTTCGRHKSFFKKINILTRIGEGKLKNSVHQDDNALA